MHDASYCDADNGPNKEDGKQLSPLLRVSRNGFLLLIFILL
jgi:hypothetical protein